MKTKSLSFQALPSRSPVLNVLRNRADLQRSDSSRAPVCFRVLSTADPFENMKFSDNKRPALRPIINKHRKCQSIESMSGDTSRIFRVKKGTLESVLPLIFTNNLQTRKIIGNLPCVVKNDTCCSERRDVGTPYFKNEGIREKALAGRDVSRNRSKRSRFFDSISQRKIQEKHSNDAFMATLGVGFKNL